jgi:hypothetical protein
VVNVLSPEESSNLARLVQKSGRSALNARRALCLAINVESGNLAFLGNTSERDFSSELIDHLRNTGHIEALLLLCGEIKGDLHGHLLDLLNELEDQLRKFNPSKSSGNSGQQSSFSEQPVSRQKFVDPWLDLFESALRSNSTNLRSVNQELLMSLNSYTAEYFSRITEEIALQRKLLQKINSPPSLMLINDISCKLPLILEIFDNMISLFSVSNDHPRSDAILSRVNQIREEIDRIKHQTSEVYIENASSSRVSQSTWNYLSILIRSLDNSLNEICALFEKIKEEVILPSSY